MSRAHLDYTTRRTFDRAYEGFDADTPVEGYYRFRMRSGGAFCGVRIWYGQPLDPLTRDPLDRSLRWNALVNDADVDLERVWPACARNPIDADEYRHLCALQDWARENAPQSALADPRRRADPLSNPLPF